MKVKANRIENGRDLYVVCGQCGYRLATLLSGGKVIDEPIPWECPLCHTQVERWNGDSDHESAGTET